MVDELLFDGGKNKYTKLANIFIFVLFGMGFFLWIRFFDFGNFLNINDWRYASREYQIVQEAFSKNVVPYHFSPEMYETNRFFSLPHIVVSPQILFLKYFSMSTYPLSTTLLFYTLGFIGCLLLKKKYKLSLFSFSFLFLIFSFNGNIVSHLSVGHFVWLSYFLLPYFALFLFDYLDHRNKISLLKLSAILALFVYQGGYHLYVWCMILITVMALTEMKYYKDYLAVFTISVMLSFARLLPPFITYWNKKHEFLIGFPNINVLINSLITVQDMTYKWIGPVFGSLRWHEYDSYIDIFGLGIIIYFGIVILFKHPKVAIKNRFKELDIPLTVMTIFTLNYLYNIVRAFHLPLLNSERAPARFIILVIFFMAVISSVRMDDWFKEIKPNIKVKCLMVIGLLQMACALIVHAKAWSLIYINEYFGDKAVSLDSTTKIINLPDPFYVFSVKFSAIVSLITFIFVIVKYINLRRNQIQPS